MTTLRETLAKAIEALESADSRTGNYFNAKGDRLILTHIITDLRAQIEALDKAEPVGYLHIEHFRGCKSMENANLDYVGDLPQGNYPLYTNPQPAPSWQPIETAPRDGTAVLVMRDIWPGTESGHAEKCNGHNTYVAEWWAGDRDGQGAWICYIGAVCDPHCPVEPTHWMHLPAAPEAPKP